MKDKDTKLLEEAYQQISENFDWYKRLEVSKDPDGKGFFIKAQDEKMETGPETFKEYDTIEQVIDELQAWKEKGFTTMKSVRGFNLSNDEWKQIQAALNWKKLNISHGREGNLS